MKLHLLRSNLTKSSALNNYCFKIGIDWAFKIVGKKDTDYMAGFLGGNYVIRSISVRNRNSNVIAYFI